MAFNSNLSNECAIDCQSTQGSVNSVKYRPTINQLSIKWPWSIHEILIESESSVDQVSINILIDSQSRCQSKVDQGSNEGIDCHSTMDDFIHT